MDNFAVEFEEVRARVRCELQNAAIILEELKQRIQRLETGHQNLGWRTGLIESRIDSIEDRLDEGKTA